jgi:hypothetical protein
MHGFGMRDVCNIRKLEVCTYALDNDIRYSTSTRSLATPIMTNSLTARILAAASQKIDSDERDRETQNNE